jgi:hypothetical protein
VIGGTAIELCLGVWNPQRTSSRTDAQTRLINGATRYG